MPKTFRPFLIGGVAVALAQGALAEGYYFRVPNGSPANSVPAGSQNGVEAQPIRTVAVTIPDGGRVGRETSIMPSVSGPTLATAIYGITGTLPTGVSFDPATGALGGVPTQYGIFPGIRISVVGTDAAGVRVTGESTAFDLVVAPPPTVTVARLAYTGFSGASFDGTEPPYASDTLGTVAWSIEPDLPQGLTLSSVGTVIGKPAAAGTYTGRLVATDIDGAQARSQPLTIAVATPSPLSLGTYGNNVAFTNSQSNVPGPSISGGVPPYSFALVKSDGSAATPPPGLGFSTTSGAITGIANAADTYGLFQIKVTDAAGSAPVSTSLFTVVTRPQANMDRLAEIRVNGVSVGKLGNLPYLPTQQNLCIGGTLEAFFSAPVTMRYLAFSAGGSSGVPEEVYEYLGEGNAWVVARTHAKETYTPRTPNLVSASRWRVRMTKGCYTGINAIYLNGG